MLTRTPLSASWWASPGSLPVLVVIDALQQPAIEVVDELRIGDVLRTIAVRAAAKELEQKDQQDGDHGPQQQVLAEISHRRCPSFRTATKPAPHNGWLGRNRIASRV
jgi:hypothetical protein